MTNSELSREKTLARFAPNDELLPCPFCGGKPMVEEVKLNLDIANFTVGCTTEDCMGYQSTTTFARRHDAAVAWNKRAPR